MKKLRVIIGIIFCFLAAVTWYMTISDPYTDVLEGTLLFSFLGIVFLAAGFFPGKK